MSEPLNIDAKTLRAVVGQLTKKLTDEGMLIEAGWVGFASMCIPPTATEYQRRVMHKTFFAGAHHLFSSVMSILDPGAEATDQDLERMSKIHDELQRFSKQLKQSMQ